LEGADVDDFAAVDLVDVDDFAAVDLADFDFDAGAFLLVEDFDVCDFFFACPLAGVRTGSPADAEALRGGRAGSGAWNMTAPAAPSGTTSSSLTAGTSRLGGPHPHPTSVGRGPGPRKLLGRGGQRRPMDLRSCPGTTPDHGGRSQVAASVARWAHGVVVCGPGPIVSHSTETRTELVVRVA